MAASLGSAAAIGAGAGLAADVAMGKLGFDDGEDPSGKWLRRGRRVAVGAGAGLVGSMLTNALAGSGAIPMGRPDLSGGLPGGSSISTRFRKLHGMKTSSWRPSDVELKRYIMHDSTIPDHVRVAMFREVDAETRGRGRSTTIDSIVHHGGGALAGYFGALRMGAGPVARATAAAVGAMVGGAVLHNRNRSEWSYTPNFTLHR